MCVMRETNKRNGASGATRSNISERGSILTCTLLVLYGYMMIRFLNWTRGSAFWVLFHHFFGARKRRFL